MSETATVTAISVRKDGKAFKANVPKYGEIWLGLGDRLAGKVEWKKSYEVDFHIKPGERGDFYNVTRVAPVGAPSAVVASKTNGNATSVASDPGPHRGMWEKEVSNLLREGWEEEQIHLHIITCRRIARKALATDIDARLPEPGLQTDPNDSLEF